MAKQALNPTAACPGPGDRCWKREAIVTGLTLLLAATIGPPAATAAPGQSSEGEEQSAQAVEPPSEWSFTIAPYLWMAGMKGDVAAFGSRSFEVDVGFRDILDDLDFGGMAVAEARHGRFSLSSDLLFLKLSTSANTPLGLLASEVDLDVEVFEFTALAGYALIDTPSAHLDIVAGPRVWSVEETLSLDGGFLDGRDRNDSATWVDGLGGIKGRANLTSNIHLAGWALVGGGEADHDWDLFGGVGYAFNSSISAVLGYRAVGVDYRDGSFQFDVVIQGPVIGAVFRF